MNETSFARGATVVQRQLLRAVSIGFSLAMPAAFAYAQGYPVKAVRLVVTSPPGGSQDCLARLLGQALGPALGQQVLVDNRTGASGVIGIDFVAKAAPDGYTILLGAAGPIAIVPALKAKLPFDPLRDFAAITLGASSSFVLVVHPSVPARSMKALIALATAKPRSLNYGSSGAGASPHLAMELLKSMARIDLVHIPYKGVGPALTDLVGGQIDAMLADVHLVAPHVENGRLRVLAVAGTKRSAALPEVPTAAEAGLPGYTAGTWFGLLAPAATPAPVIARLNGEIEAILASPALRDRLRTQGIEPQASTPEQFAAHLRSEIEKWRKVAVAAAIKLD
jgi:tripartite-type tricarboxylate transporter receptor subunit TctC